MDMNTMIRVISGPLIGALIGYCTNYIAVKMLFRPLHPVKIGNFKVPFTPGIIPKGRDRMAHAVGETVGNTLLTEEDITKVLLTDEMKQAVTQYIVNDDTMNQPLKQLLTERMGEEKLEEVKEKTKDIVCTKIIEGCIQINLGQIIADKGIEAAKEKLSSSFLGMMIGGDMLASFAGPVRDYINEYVGEHGEETIEPVVNGEITKVLEQTPYDTAEEFTISKEKMKSMAGDLYEQIVRSKANEAISKLNLGKIVEDKIKAMDVLEIEEMVLSIMKKELNAIVNLGALIGFILGMLNMVI